jgi:hypothetical protein
MEKLFAALEEKHFGYKVADVRFLVEHSSADGNEGISLDESLAKAVREAVQADIAIELA